MAKRLCHAKYQEEITKRGFDLLKQRIASHKSSPSFTLPEEPLFNQIEDKDIQKNLHHQYMNKAKQAKEDMLQLYLSSAETQMDRYRKQSDTNLKQLRLEQHSLLNDKKLSSIMIHLIEQRYKNVSECVECWYKHQTDLRRFNSNHKY